MSDLVAQAPTITQIPTESVHMSPCHKAAFRIQHASGIKFQPRLVQPLWLY